MSPSDWVQLATSLSVFALCVTSGLVLRQHWQAIRQLNRSLELLDEGIKILVAASGVHILQTQHEREGSVVIDTPDGLRAEVNVVEISTAATRKEKLH